MSKFIIKPVDFSTVNANYITGTSVFMALDSTNGNKLTRMNSGGTKTVIESTGGGSSSSELSINNQTGSTYTLVLSDSGKLLELNKSTAQTLLIPTNASVAFPTGTQIMAYQAGIGQLSFSGTSGVTMNSSGGKFKTGAQFAAATLIKTATDTWLLSGDITT
jgi:hypothetical protein